MLNWLLAAVLAGATQGAESWKPPKNPDPSKILHEAAGDAHAGRHELALAKLLWFHNNALKYDQALSGVRLSFALGYWSDLAEAYPPALEALQRTRDDALKRFKQRRDTDGAFDPFHEFEAINEQLGEEALTARTFVELDGQDPVVAERVFDVAREALIKAKEYELCGKYLRPADDWLRAAQLYQLNRREEKRYGPEHTEYLEKSFTHEVATLLALLVVIGRQEEAETIAKKARLEWDDPAFHGAIDSALAGVMPDPWP